jgi:hypothetical protein
MGLLYQIPKTATFLNTSNTFTAGFNVPTPGLYDFNTAANDARPVISLNTNAIYLINRITIAGTIPQDEYLFNIVTLPRMILKFSIENQRVYSMSLPVVQFVDDLEAVAFFWSDKAGEKLTMSITTGQLSQDAFLVGTASVKLNVLLTIFEITDNGFINDFKRDNSITTIGKRTRNVPNNLMFVED